MKNVMMLILTVAFSGFLFSQESKSHPMEKLNFMVGEWEGTSWAMTREGEQSATVTETIECQQDCRVITARGLGIKTDSITGKESVVHDAFGVMFYDSQKSEYKIRAYKDDKISESVITFLSENKLQWSPESPGPVKVRFTMDFTQQNQWTETGEYSMDGKTWTNFLRMDLKRKP